MEKLKKRWGRRASGHDEDTNSDSEGEFTALDNAKCIGHGEHVGLVHPVAAANLKRASEPLITYRASERSNLDKTEPLNRQSSELRTISARLGRLSPAGAVHADNALGLTLVHCPPEPLFDLIFLHGLGGTSHGTWSNERDQRHFWPPWLADDIGLSACRTFTFGYNAPFAFHFSSAGILDFAKDLLFRMKTFSGESRDDGPQIGKLPVAFVAHSMGGLVAKKAYIIGRSDTQYSDIAVQVQAMIFLATPHKGSQHADMLNNILKALPHGSAKQYVADIAHNSGALQEINEQFRNMCADLRLISFHETQKTLLGAGLKRLLVDKESSILGYPGEHSSSLVADHHGMTKFKSRQDSNYIDVRNALRFVVRDHVTESQDLEQSTVRRRLSSAATVVADAKLVAEASNQQRLKDILGVADSFKDEFDYFTERLMQGTCQWLSDQTNFRDWAAGSSSASNVLWLTAGPGSGKSTWASFAVSWLRKSRYQGTCQHHFFQGSNQQKRTISYSLRSIAFQVALAHKEFSMRLIELCDSTGITFAQQKPTVIWEKIFEGILFPLTFDAPMYWVFDGLDESESHADLLKLLNKIKSSTTVNILFLSRYDNNISRDMNQYLPSRVHRHISPDDFLEDISDYVRRSMSHTLSDPSHEKIVQRVLKMAAGSFLWVKLALDKIKSHWHTEEGIMCSLTEVPEGMEAMFRRMIEDIARQPADLREMATRILTWTVCCFRPLRIDELDNALSPEFTGFVNLAQTVEDVCAQFAMVSKNRVTLVHETARVFLLQKTSNLAISIDGALGHEHAADACIGYLSDIPKWRRVFESIQSTQDSKARKHSLAAFDDYPFLDYALFYWSYHVSYAPVDSDEMLERVLEFLETHLLLWINGIAVTGNLVILIKTAENLKTFLKRRARSDRKKITAAYSKVRDGQIHQWATDLVRVLGRFGNNLRQDPSCAYRYVVPFCPEESVIYRSFSHSSSSGFTVIGKFKSWDDCLARLRASGDEMATKLLCKEKFFIGLAGTSGTLIIWDSETFEELKQMKHKEYVSCVATSSISNLVATAGHKTTRVWNINTGEELLELPRNTHAKTLAMAFGANDTELVIAYDDCMIKYFDLTTGGEKWAFKVKEAAIDNYTCPRNMSFSPDLRHVAVVYRGRPVFVWKLRSSALPKRCVCLEDRFSNKVGAWNASEKAIWHPDNDHLLILYEDTKIMYWNVMDDGQVQHDHTGARALTLSKDGNLLLTSDVSGSLSVWTMPDLQLTYQLKSDELVMDLAFTTDNSRFCDLRGGFCNVWETDAIIKANEIDEDDRSSTQDTFLSEPVLATDYRSRENVTAICCDSSDKYYCCGFDDGTVSIFDISDGMKVRNKVMSHEETTSVIKIVWSASDEYLASADDSGRTIVKRLEPPTQKKRKWAVFGVVDFSTQEAVEQLLFSAHGDLLLVSCSETAIVVDVARKRETCRRCMPPARGSFWVINPLNPAFIIRVDGSHEKQYDWAKLSTPESSPSASLTSHLSSYTLTPQSQDTTVVHKAFPTRRNNWVLELLGPTSHRRSIEILDFGRSTRSTSSVMTRREIKGLADIVSDLLGCFQDRVVFLDRDYWACTWDLTLEYGRHQRHFFLPKYLYLAIPSQGDVICIAQPTPSVIAQAFSKTELARADSPKFPKTKMTELGHVSQPTSDFELDEAVLQALPVKVTEVISINAYGSSMWSRPARIVARLPDGSTATYFLKVTTGENDRMMSEGQYEADKALHGVMPSFTARPFTWGKYQKEGIPPHYFLLSEFREIGQQPPDPIRLTRSLAQLHRKSVSPTGKFGFHINTCHAKMDQLTDLWEDSWEMCYGKQLKHTFDRDRDSMPPWPEFHAVADLILDICVPALLRPLQTGGRSIKPCLVHGNIWDMNTATDVETGEPFVFDGSAMYAHNEYELGNWRTPRHRLSSRSYIRNYKKCFPASEPVKDWDSRNLLYSIRYNVCAAVVIPGSNYRDNVFEDMKELCRRICPEELDKALKPSTIHHNNDDDRGDEEEEEEEEVEEEEEEEEEAEQ